MSDLTQRAPFDATPEAAARPTWLPDVDLPPDDWHLWRSGDFPTAVDSALLELEEAS